MGRGWHAAGARSNRAVHVATFPAVWSELSRALEGLDAGQGSAADAMCNGPSVPKPVRGVLADAALPVDILR
jgi:hypothetical protein